MALVTDPATAVAASPPPAPPRRGAKGARTLVCRFVGYAVLIFFSLVFLYPFVSQISNSFKTEADAADNPLSPIPDPFTTTSMSRIFEGTDFPLWLGNSVLVTVIVTLGRVLLDSMAGYALARLRFRGRGAVFATIIEIMAVPGGGWPYPKILWATPTGSKKN